MYIFIILEIDMWKALFHLIGAIQFSYGCYYDFMYVRLPSTSTIVTPYGGKLKYLTYLNAVSIQYSI